MYYVYISANVTGTVIYTGVNNDIASRVYKHKLVYYESTSGSYEAIFREKK